MTREEALIFFQIEDEEDLQDALEEQLFELKKFFLSKAPIAKLYEGRIRKLVKTEEAFLALSAHIQKEEHHSVQAFEMTGFGSILDTYLLFQKHKNDIKRQISNASAAGDLLLLAEALVNLEKANAETWYIESADENDIIVSKEPDPMYLLAAIKSYRENGGESFNQLKNLENNPPQLLIQEMKRLSLLFKKY